MGMPFWLAAMRVFRAHIHKVNRKVICGACQQSEAASNFEMKLDHTVSCRNDLVQDAYHAGQAGRNMNTYGYNTYRVFRADE